MVKLTNAETALMGLLSEGPMYPYQIEQQVKYRDMRFWTDLSMSSIYKLLKKLEDSGLVTLESHISTANRLQKLYSLNAAGIEAFKNRLEDILRTPEHQRWQFDIGLYNLDVLDGKTAISALTDQRAELEKKIAGYHDLEKFLAESACPAHRLELARRPVFLLEAEIRWIDRFLNQFAGSGDGESE